MVFGFYLDQILIFALLQADHIHSITQGIPFP